jgi:uncharacterized protein YbjT (DUF2867 family)
MTAEIFLLIYLLQQNLNRKGYPMSNKQIIAVVGATGAQGGGLVRVALADGKYTIRALTRKPDSDKAKALASAGAEVVAADLDDVASLTRALQGAYGAFLVTNFWEHFSPEKEKQQAKNLAQAAKAAGVQHVIWSTLEDTRKDVPLSDDRMPTLMGEYKVPHFDAKGEADQYFIDAGVPTTFLRASFYWDNFVYFGSGPTRGQDGVLTLGLPMGDKELAGVAAEDIGGVAYGIFLKGREFIGQTVGVAGEHVTGADMAAKMSAALGEEVRYAPVPPAVFRTFGFPGAEDLGNMFQYYQEFEKELGAVRSVERSRELHPKLQNFDQWLAKNASKIPLEVSA